MNSGAADVKQYRSKSPNGYQPIGGVDGVRSDRIRACFRAGPLFRDSCRDMSE